MGTTLAHFTSKCGSISKKAPTGPSGPAVKQGDGGYADWVIIALHGLKEHLGHTYRQLMDVLQEMPGIVRRLELTVETLPHYSTVCHAKERLYMPNWRQFLTLTANLRELGDVQAIDASGFDRIAASRKYAHRTNYTVQAMKTTVLVDCDTGTIIDVHCSTNRPHDTQVGRQVLARNLDQLSIVTADKGYDSQQLRRWLRAHNVQPVIKHRVFGLFDYARNRLHDDSLYHQRSVAETVIRILKQRFGDRLHARTWYGQFREIVIRSAVKNIEDYVKAESDCA